MNKDSKIHGFISSNENVHRIIFDGAIEMKIVMYLDEIFWLKYIKLCVLQICWCKR